MFNLEPVFMRENIIKAIRSYLYEQEFHEVIVPVLNRSVPHEPNLHPFSTGRHYLSLSPERGLKRMLARGIGDCFAIAKSFRDLEGSGSRHIPEFLMLEWYRKQADYGKIMEDAKSLILYIGTKLGKDIPVKLTGEGAWKKLSLKDLFKQYAGFELIDILKQENAIYEIADKKGYRVKGATWWGLWDQIFVNDIEPQLPAYPVFITDYPARLSPLCSRKKDEPLFAQRFELYIRGVEIANGNTENTEVAAIRSVFEKEKKERINSIQPIDEEFLAALEGLGNVPFAGCGLGIDRLVMLLSGTDSITGVEQLLEL